MPKQVTQLKCLVISPSDVSDAREAVVEVIQNWNAHAGESMSARVEAVRWESHARPQMGGPPQTIINNQLVDDCDFGIAIFWSRLGSPTSEYASGSVEEIERLLSRGANVMVYFCEAPVPQSALGDGQYDRLQEVKKEFRQRGLLSSYSSVERLREYVLLHVNGTVNALLIQHRAAGQPIPSQGTATAPLPDVRVRVIEVVASRGESNNRAAISVEVQNHSPHVFFFSTLLFQLNTGEQIFVHRNVLTGELLTPRTIEPGNSFTFFADPWEFRDALGEGREPTVVIAKDKIDRRFPSPDGALSAAYRNAIRTAEKLARG